MENVENDNSKKNSWLSKILKIGNIKILLIILVLLIVGVLILNKTSSSSVATTTSSLSNYTTSLEYVEMIENKLVDVIKGIKGAGKTKVMISISSSPELSVANNVEEKTVTSSTGSTTTTTSEPIIVRQNGEDVPLILKETLPEICGVIVVSEGAKDIKVRLDIILAVSTALGINSNIVEVFAGK